MVDEIAFGSEFFALLVQQDEELVRRIAAEGCLVCGENRLHRSDYPRKPRGAMIASSGEAWVMRFSLCCGVDGCRKRVTPPSMRFLGRRVYLGIVVIVASLAGQAIAKASELRTQTGVPPRTVRRWLSWWQGFFPSTEVFVAIRARLFGVSIERLPSSITDQLPGTFPSRITALLVWLAPLTTGSASNAARILRGIV